MVQHIWLDIKISLESLISGFSSKNSDIDLLVILNEAEETIRGVQFFEGKKIEYLLGKLIL